MTLLLRKQADYKVFKDLLLYLGKETLCMLMLNEDSLLVLEDYTVYSLLVIGENNIVWCEKKMTDQLHHEHDMNIEKTRSGHMQPHTTVQYYALRISCVAIMGCVGCEI